MNLIQISVLLIIWLCNVHQVISGTVEAIKTNLEVPVNQTVNLRWRVVLGSGERVFGLEVNVLESSNVLIMEGSKSLSTITPAGKAMFGNRLSGGLSNGIYTLSIKKIKFNEKKSFNLEVAFKSESIQSENATVVIKNVVDPSVHPPPSDKKKDNTGVIVGVVVTLLIIIAIVIVVVLILRRRREQLNKSGEGQQLTSVQTTQPRDEMPQYAQPSAAMSQDQPKQVYAEVNRSGGGGRDGPRPDNLKTDYAQMKVGADGYPATGPTSGVPDSPKPEKPARGIPRHSAE